eukprot:827370-Lingulodinium_polyedra.AAC.1
MPPQRGIIPLRGPEQEQRARWQQHGLSRLGAMLQQPSLRQRLEKARGEKRATWDCGATDGQVRRWANEAMSREGSRDLAWRRSVPTLPRSWPPSDYKDCKRLRPWDAQTSDFSATIHRLAQKMTRGCGRPEPPAP